MLYVSYYIESYCVLPVSSSPSSAPPAPGVAAAGVCGARAGSSPAPRPAWDGVRGERPAGAAGQAAGAGCVRPRASGERFVLRNFLRRLPLPCLVIKFKLPNVAECGACSVWFVRCCACWESHPSRVVMRAAMPAFVSLVRSIHAPFTYAIPTRKTLRSRNFALTRC